MQQNCTAHPMPEAIRQEGAHMAKLWHFYRGILLVLSCGDAMTDGRRPLGMARVSRRRRTAPFAEARRMEGMQTQGGRDQGMAAGGGKAGLAPEDRVLFIINDMAVRGSTRMQKYGFLLSKQHERDLYIPQMENEGFRFYSDWEPYYFGPYSRELRDDIEKGASNGNVIARKHGRATTYSLALRGRARWRAILARYPYETKRMAAGIRRLQTVPLHELLRQVYAAYPKYAEKSQIRDRL